MRVFDGGFVRSEFGCNCGCGLDSIDAETLEVLEDIRRWANAPVLILSGCRCQDHNETVGGKPDSYHLIARASDIYVHGKTPKQVAEYLEEKYPLQYGIGTYRTFVHIDTREMRARWGTV